MNKIKKKKKTDKAAIFNVAYYRARKKNESSGHLCMGQLMLQKKHIALLLQFIGQN